MARKIKQGGSFVDLGGGGGGNATVPNDAPIQPPQAFVDASVALLGQTAAAFNVANKGITSVDAALFEIYRSNSGMPSVNLSGNALSVSSVNAILAEFAAHPFEAAGDLIINLSGGTNGAPTGQGINDKATLIGDGWAVTTN